ncbi:unnamed protein product [Ceutorhynchus assimilis]|uniref:Gustatory receptor n=1 Tax=Ceutorhynchus assimilis TaxID=467358 RepID=A0A9P0GXD3_9CUCU|nr:unnamed protein product [Ceutorhynchus assimilis]
MVFNAINFLLIIKEKFDDIEKLLVPNKRITLRKCRKIYQEMLHVCRLFNKLFGGSLFLIFFYYGYNAILYTTTSYMKYKSGEINATIYTIYTVVFHGCGVFIPLVVTLFGHHANNQTKKLQKTCLLLQENVPLDSERYLELREFYDQIEHQQVKFTAARFFDLERSTVIGYSHVISTYFITFIQFLILLT